MTDTRTNMAPTAVSAPSTVHRSCSYQSKQVFSEPRRSSRARNSEEVLRCLHNRSKDYCIPVERPHSRMLGVDMDDRAVGFHQVGTTVQVNDTFQRPAGSTDAVETLECAIFDSFFDLNGVEFGLEDFGCAVTDNSGRSPAEPLLEYMFPDIYDVHATALLERDFVAWQQEQQSSHHFFDGTIDQISPMTPFQQACVPLDEGAATSCIGDGTGMLADAPDTITFDCIPEVCELHIPSAITLSVKAPTHAQLSDDAFLSQLLADGAAAGTMAGAAGATTITSGGVAAGTPAGSLPVAAGTSTEAGAATVAGVTLRWIRVGVIVGRLVLQLKSTHSALARCQWCLRCRSQRVTSF